MKRPPDRKVVLAALVLLVAAGMMTARPVTGFAQKLPDLNPALRKG